MSPRGRVALKRSRFVLKGLKRYRRQGGSAGSEAYIRAVRDHLPDATLVFDRFHVVKLMNDKLSHLLRELQREAEAQQKDVLKGTRWPLLKHPARLDRARKETERPEEALKLNAPLAAAYYFKEDLRRFWNRSNKDEAALLLDDWIGRARATGSKQLRQMANTHQRDTAEN